MGQRPGAVARRGTKGQRCPGAHRITLSLRIKPARARFIFHPQWGHMAENYGYGRYRDEYDDEDEGYEAGYDDAADDDDHGYEDDTDVLTDEPVDDRSLLTGAVDEPVHEVLDDPTVDESASYERIRRLKGSRRWQAWDRRKGAWIPPDLRKYGQPVFWPVEEPNEAQGPARRVNIDPSKITGDVLRQVLMQPLASCPEIARALALDEVVVKKAGQALLQEGLLRSVSFGCLRRPTARYWVEPEEFDTTSWSDLEQAVMSWHSDAGIGSLLRYDIPKVETINDVASRYSRAGWGLEGLAWVEGEAIQAIGLYRWRQWDWVTSLVFFVWVSQWETEREIWERLADLPAAVRRITEPGIAGHVVLVGADRWAVARALPMAMESLKDSPIETADVAAWNYSAGWQAATGKSMLDGAGKPPFRPWLAAAPVDRFVWPRARRRLGRTKLDSIIRACPWTRSDAPSLFLYLKLMGEHPGGAIAHYAALAGKSDKNPIPRKRFATLLELGLAREAGRVGVADVGTPDKPEVFSERGRWQMRYRVSLGPKGEGEPAKRRPGESKVDHARRTANGMHLVMLGHGGLSYREAVRRSGAGKLSDRFGDRLVHEDVLVDVLGRLAVLGCEVVPASRARTVNEEGFGIDPDGMLYGTSPVGTGFHYLELERSRLGPTAIKNRLEKYKLQLTSYPLAVVCKTTRGARNFDRIGQQLGVAIITTSLHRLRTIGLAGPCWIHHGQDVAVYPAPCPPRPATP